MRRALLFEVGKLGSVPSVRWLAGVAVLLSIAVPLLVLNETEGDQIALVFVLPLMVQIVQFLVLAAGCVSAGHQFGTGIWQTTLLAFPRRLSVVMVQGITVTSASVLLGMVVAAAFLSAAGFAGAPVATEDLGKAAGAGLYLTLLSVLGWAVTLACRSTVAALGTLSTAVLIVPVLAQIVQPFAYLPGSAGTSLFEAAALDRPGTGSFWLMLWVFLALIAATLTAQSRDCSD